jgi:hypothetical protein
MPIDTWIQQIHNYEISIRSPTANHPDWLAHIRLFGETSEIALIQFHPDGASLPEPEFETTASHKKMHMPICRLHAVMDMLRTEKPCYVYCSRVAGNVVYISTGREPVGEQEGLVRRLPF